MLRETLGGDISPKSVVSSGTGLVFAQNMMYQHSVTVYDARKLELEKTISDTVSLADFGYKRYSGTQQGAPVEAAFSPDGKYAYVSNYSMYGEGFGPEGDDECTPASGLRQELRLPDLAGDARDRRRLPGRRGAEGRRRDPDGRFVLVVELVHLGPQRHLDDGRAGGAADPDGRVPRGHRGLAGRGRRLRGNHGRRRSRPRRPGHVGDVHHPDRGRAPRARDRPLRGTDLRDPERAGRVARLDLPTGRVRTVSTGTLPRSLAIAADAKAIYVVNYESGTVTKLRTKNIKVLQTIDACFHPIGITYDAPTQRVWVACYGGSILVYDDRR